MRSTTDTAADAVSTRVLVDRVADLAVHASRLAAEKYETVDRLRVAYETEHGATYTDPDDLAWRDLRAEVAAAL